MILASASPRRAKILASLGYDFRVAPSEAEEVSIPRAPRRTVLVNAARKLKASKAMFPTETIIAADTIVWFDGRILGKPKNLEEAKEYLRMLSAREHSVFTGVAWVELGGELQTRVVESKVKFRPLSEETIEEYVKRVQPVDRAGAYDIDENGKLLVEGFSGSYENIMGLPILDAFLPGRLKIIS